MTEERKLLREALRTLQNHADAVTYDSIEDEVGRRVCCGVVSYKPHEKACEIDAAITNITALLAAPAPEPVWIQSNHLQNAMKAPFLCRVEPTKRDGFIPLYTTPPAQDTRRLALEEAANSVPKNWCDPLLTGDSAVVGPNVNCHEVEHLLTGVANRIRALAAKEDKQ